jgi:hypothetical protein
MMAPLLREWVLLREREIELLRRMAELLESSSRGRDAVDDAREAAVETDAPRGDPPDDPSVHPGDDPAWIDRTIDAVLAGAFSADPEPEATELPAVDLLLLRSGGTWVGMPWDRVTRLGLSDDAQPLPCVPLALRDILGLGGTGDTRDDTAEPYCLTWETAGGPRALRCEVLGGVVAAPAAAARGVDLVWLPDDSDAGGRLLPLVEFFASIGGDGRKEVEAPRPRLDDTVRARAPSQAMTGHGGPRRDTRHVLRSGLVSVRYLPARVAIARALRSHGWFVLEAADAAELPALLQRVHHAVVFIEAPERPEPEWTKELARAQDGGARFIGVASRLRGVAGDPWRGRGATPHLLYPFQEAELERLIESLVQPEGG